MRTLLTLVLPALLLAGAPAQAQAQVQHRTAPDRQVEAGDLGPARNLIGKTVMYRYRNSAVGTIRDVVTGEDGRPKLVVDLKDSRRQVVLDTSEVDRRGSRINLMLDPEQIAGLPDYQSSGARGAMGSTSRAPAGTGR